MSEFGKGLCYCLGLFLAHTERLNQDVKVYKEMQKKNPELFDENSAAELWFNGASDHLYELQVEVASDELKNRLLDFQEKVLHWGHGFQEQKPTLKDAHWAIHEAKDLLRLIDEDRGIQTEKGQLE